MELGQELLYLATSLALFVVSQADLAGREEGNAGMWGRGWGCWGHSRALYTNGEKQDMGWILGIVRPRLLNYMAPLHVLCRRWIIIPAL